MIRRSEKWQLESSLCDLRLWNLDENRKGHLAVCGIDTIDLVEKYGSPLLAVNQKRLMHDAQKMQKALSTTTSDSKVLYSYKTNCIPGILKEIHKLGIGAEVISPYELWLAEQLNVPGGSIVFNGVNKTDESIKRAIKMDILAINIDHLTEIERIYRLARQLDRKVRVGVRLALSPKSQFGFEIARGEAMEACKRIAALSDYLDFDCIHFNVTSNAKWASTHKNCALRALQFMHQLKKKTGINISYLDIGGGFGVPTTKNMSGKEYGLYRLFGCLPKPPLLADYQPIDSFFSEVITSIEELSLELNLEMPKILIEPGRFITSRCEFLLTTVLTTKLKQNGTRFAITDAGRLSITFPCDFEYHEVFVADSLQKEKNLFYHVMGRICTSADWMFKNRYLPELKPGDVLAIMDAGAYFSSYSTNFAFPRPAIVMISNGKSRLIQKQETFEHLIAMDISDLTADN